MKTELPRSHWFNVTSYTRFQLSSHVGSTDIFPTFQSCRFAVSKHRSYLVSFETETFRFSLSLSLLPELYDSSRIITFDRTQSTSYQALKPQRKFA